MMEKEIENLRNGQLEMAGRLLAGFSHELKNHLAIIKESNGLIADLLSMGRVEDPALRTRFEKITDTINKRTLMAAEMAKHLNGFAHRSDTPLSPFQLHDVLNEELAFLSRFANLKSISLSLSFTNALPVVYTDPSLVQFIFASLFFHILPTLKSGGKIIVSSGLQNSSVSFGIVSEGKTSSDTVPGFDAVEHDQALQAALRVIGASLSIQPADGRNIIIICTIPLSLKSDAASTI